MLLGLGWHGLRVLLPGAIEVRLGRLARSHKRLGQGRSSRPGRGPQGRPALRELPLLRPAWQRRREEHFWGSWVLRRVARWSQSQLQGPNWGPGPALEFYKGYLPQRLFFRDAYALKFYYALKEHARVGIVAHGQRGYRLRGPQAGTRRRGPGAWWKKAKGLEGPGVGGRGV